MSYMHAYMTYMTLHIGDMYVAYGKGIYVTYKKNLCRIHATYMASGELTHI